MGFLSKRLLLTVTVALIAITSMYYGMWELSLHSSQMINNHLAEETEPAVVAIYNETKSAQGTGFKVTSKDGTEYLITNRHVCEGGVKFSAVAYDMFRFNVNIVKVSKKYDLCMMTAPKMLKSLDITDDYYWGQMVYVTGHPNGYRFHVAEGKIVDATISPVTYKIGLFPEATCTANHGTIKDEVVFEGNGFAAESERVCETENQYLVISTLIEGGNSGSPVVNIDGEVVGVLAQKDQNHWGFAIPVIDLKDFLEEK